MSLLRKNAEVGRFPSALDVPRTLAIVLLVMMIIPSLATSGDARARVRADHTGPNNSITDVPGVRVGHRTHKQKATGTTVMLMPKGALVAASPSGGAPGNRATATLTAMLQDTARQDIHAILLNGGSIFGLDAGCGVSRFIRKRYGQQEPMVPGAIIYDLARGTDYDASNANAEPVPNNCNIGFQAAKKSTSGAIRQGSVGAGAGANSGGVKGGLGTASSYLGNGIYVGAIIVVNSAGSTFKPTNCKLYALHLEKDNEFGPVKAPTDGCGGGERPLPRTPESGVDENTTIGVVATNAPLTAGQLEWLAWATVDGMARAIRASRTPVDGDTIFAVSTARSPAPAIKGTFEEAKWLAKLGAEAADTWSRAAVHAILNAGRGNVLGATYCESYPGACPGGGGGRALSKSEATQPAGGDTALASSADVRKTDPAGLLVVVGMILLAVVFVIRRWTPRRRGGGTRS